MSRISKTGSWANCPKTLQLLSLKEIGDGWRPLLPNRLMCPSFIVNDNGQEASEVESRMRRLLTNHGLYFLVLQIDVGREPAMVNKHVKVSCFIIFIRLPATCHLRKIHSITTFDLRSLISTQHVINEN